MHVCIDLNLSRLKKLRTEYLVTAKSIMAILWRRKQFLTKPMLIIILMMNHSIGSLSVVSVIRVKALYHNLTLTVTFFL